MSLLPYYANDPTSADADMVATIELGLAEISDAVTTEDGLRDSLRAALIEQPIKFNWILGSPELPSMHVTSGSSNQTLFNLNNYPETTTGPMPATPSISYATTFVGSEVGLAEPAAGT